MGKYISYGQYNKNFKYIIFACFFNILVNLIFGLDLNDNFNEILLFNSKGQKILYKHSRVHEIFRNIGVFIFACTFYKIEAMLNREEMTSHKIESYSSKESNNQIILIFNDLNDEMGSISILNFIFVITIYVCIENLSDIYDQLGLMIFDFWMFELLIISYINAKMFKLKIYRHQIFAILFNSLICILFRLPSFIVAFLMEDDKNGISLYEYNNWYIALGLFIYIMIITIRAYSYTKLKWFIDLKYISSTKLLIYIGFIGIFVSSISCIIESFIKCSTEINLCKVSENNIYYLDNFIIYIENVSKLENAKEIIYEICVILLGMICRFFALYYDMLIIKFLTPVHIIFYSSIFYFLIKLIALFYNKIENSNFFKGKEMNDKKRFYIFLLDMSGNFIAIFGFLIYLEIIELGFCNLNYNLRKFIEIRSIEDTTQNIDYYSFNEEDEQSEKDKNSIISELESKPL